MSFKWLSVLLHLASLLQLAAADTNGTGGNTSCTPARCGNLSITFPFWLSGVQPLYCGWPALELMCVGTNRTYLRRTSRERLYRVRNIFYDNGSLVMAVETNFAGDATCPIPDFNVSADLSLSPLNISDTNRNLVFVYHCSLHQNMLPPSACVHQSRHTMGAYISNRSGDGSAPSWVPRNCSSVNVPVREFQDKEPTLEFEKMINEGFLVGWPAKQECAECVQRGGECRFVELAFQCSCPDGLRCSPAGRRKKQKIKLILIVALFAAASLIVTGLFWIYRQKGKNISFNQKFTSNESNIEEILKGCDSLVPKRYRYSELKKITGSFKDKLGEGGYGTVFKGKLEDGHKVAVKLLKGSKGNGEEFLNEVVSIRRTSHVNIVNLIGFCLHGSKRALIYEYMDNGSLEKYIYSEETRRAIGWEKLREIAIGIARGLEYLHRGCNTRIIHFDIKPHNILLDEEFCPKIADFGLAKLCNLKDSALSMAEARGTIGFIAPEVFSRGFGVVSTKSDVYSYGMTLLEIVGGRTNAKENIESSSEAYFPNWVYDRLVKDLQSQEVTCETEEIARQMALVGLWCIQTPPGNRPSMSRVIEMLEKNINELDMPPKPLLSCPSEPSYFSS